MSNGVSECYHSLIPFITMIKTILNIILGLMLSHIIENDIVLGHTFQTIAL